MKNFVCYLKENKTYVVEQWVKMLHDGGLLSKTLTTTMFEDLSSRMVDAFCSLIEHNDFLPMGVILEKVIDQSSNSSKPLSRVQKVLSLNSIRSFLLSEAVQRYEGNELCQVLMHLNFSIDKMISYLVNYLEVKCLDYESCCKKLEEIKETYQLIFGEMNDGCYINQGGTIVFANEAFCTMHGYDHEELIGKNCISLLDADTQNSIMYHFNKQLRGEIPFDRYVYLRQDKEGNKFFTENRAKLITYNGKPAVLGLCTDITERMEIEERERQRESLILIGRLTASIAHQIRNRLSAINIDLQILQDTLELEGNDRRRLEIIHEQFNYIEDFVSQMMEYAGPLKLRYRAVSIDNLINPLIASLQYRAKEEGVTLVKRIASDLPNIMVDEKKVMEALENISINALDALMDEKRNKHKIIELSADLKVHDGRQCIDLSVKDNGTGIDPDHWKHIFSPFFTEGKKNGVGLGLSIVERIINAHQGSVIVKSEKAKGACFSCVIPVDRS